MTQQLPQSVEERSRRELLAGRTGWLGGRVTSYGLAVVATALAVLLRYALDPILGNTAQYQAFFFSVMLTALIGGWGPGLLATGLGVLAGMWLFVEPRGTLTLGGSNEILYLVTFVTVGISISFVAGRLQYHRRRAERQARQMAETLGELRRTSAILNAASESTAALIEVKDRNGRVLMANPAALRAIGKPAAQVLDKTDLEFLDPRQGEAIMASDQRVMESGLTQTMEETAGDRILLSTKTPLRDEKRDVAGVIAVASDITQRKQMEEHLKRLNATLEERVAERTSELEHRARQLQRLASQLTQAEQSERRRLAGVLHDHLQQLLVGAKFGISLLRTRLADDEGRQNLQQVGDLLDQSIATSRSLTVELSPPVLSEGNLPGALRWLADWMREKHGLYVHVKADETANPVDDDTRVLLFQAVRELLFNVAKHAKIDTATVTMECCCADRVRIVVADQGTGFDPAIKRRHTDVATGMGLFSMQERFEVIGGQVDVDSAPGRGTRITLAAPLQLAEVEEGAAPAVIPTAEPTPAGPAGRSGRMACTRVLIADDHAVVRDGLAQLLQIHPDIQVVGMAGDGQEAIELTFRLRPDVVVMDVSMPRLDGIEATRRIRSQLQDVCVISLSMHAEGDIVRQVHEAGAKVHLSKAAPPEDVVAAIRDCSRSKTG